MTIDILDLIQKLSALGASALAFAAIITGFMGLWGFTWAHKQQLELKDALITEIQKDRDYWKDLAIKGAETSAKQADHVEQLTEVLEKTLVKA